MTYTKESLTTLIENRDLIEELFTIYAQERGLIGNRSSITELHEGWFNYEIYIGCGDYETTSEHYDMADFATWLNAREGAGS